MKGLLFLLLLTPITVISQIQSGVLTYGLAIGDDEGYQKSERLRDMYAKASENAKYLTFTLKFHGQSASFEINDVMDREDNGTFYAKIHSHYAGKVFFEDGATYTLSAGDFGKYYIKKAEKDKWNITSETKNIDGYLCYKATSEYVVINPKGTFRYPVVAWFCPKIPIPYGPNGYGGLPGLILELQQRNVVYGIKQMEFNPPKIPVIERDPKIKLISQEELNAKIEKRMDELKEETRKRLEEEDRKEKEAEKNQR